MPARQAGRCGLGVRRLEGAVSRYPADVVESTIVRVAARCRLCRWAVGGRLLHKQYR